MELHGMAAAGDLVHEDHEPDHDPVLLGIEEMRPRRRLRSAAAPARITVQEGHVARTRGVIGTHREQEFARAVGADLARRLLGYGHHVALIGADDPVPPGDVFVALHTDGSLDRARRGASVGYPDALGAELASAWKRAHQAGGYLGGFHRDNYTAALAGYYGFGRARGYRHRFLAEHGTTTNRADETWLFANLDACVTAHVLAIGEVVGHPRSPLTPQEDDMPPRAVARQSSPGGQHVVIGGKAQPVGSVPELQRLAAGGFVATDAEGRPLPPVVYPDAEFEAHFGSGIRAALRRVRRRRAGAAEER